MSKITDIAFGSDVKFSSQELKLGSDFFKKSSANSGKLATELYRGEFSVTDKVGDNFPIFNAFDSSSNTTASSPPTPPSTRPYIWKYQ